MYWQTRHLTLLEDGSIGFSQSRHRLPFRARFSRARRAKSASWQDPHLVRLTTRLKVVHKRMRTPRDAHFLPHLGSRMFRRAS